MIHEYSKYKSNYVKSADNIKVSQQPDEEFIHLVVTNINGVIGKFDIPRTKFMTLKISDLSNIIKQSYGDRVLFFKEFYINERLYNLISSKYLNNIISDRNSYLNIQTIQHSKINLKVPQLNKLSKIDQRDIYTTTYIQYNYEKDIPHDDTELRISILKKYIHTNKKQILLIPSQIALTLALFSPSIDNEDRFNNDDNYINDKIDQLYNFISNILYDIQSCLLQLVKKLQYITVKMSTEMKKEFIQIEHQNLFMVLDQFIDRFNHYILYLDNSPPSEERKHKIIMMQEIIKLIENKLKTQIDKLMKSF